MRDDTFTTVPDFALLGIAGLLLTSGCAEPTPSSPLGWEMDDGRLLAEWVGDKEAAAVLVMNPDECLACYSVLAPWLKERARREDQLFLLFARELGDGEHRAIRAAGIREDGVIRDGGPLPQDTPEEIAW